MSFEDDMIEYGLNDANDYMDYLMDEADRINKKLEQFNFDEDEYKRFHKKEIEQIRQQQEKEKELFQIAINNDLILKEWMINDSDKAKRWYAYYTYSPKLNNDFDDFIKRLGNSELTQKTHHNISQYIYHSNQRYKEWGNWLNKYEKYENFKTHNFNNWTNLKVKTETEYIRIILSSYFRDEETLLGYFDGNNINKKFRILTKWINENKETWTIIEKRYFTLLRSDDEYLYQSWYENFHWFDKSTVLKYKNPSLWEKHIKDFNEKEIKGTCEISEKRYKELWMMYNQSIWVKWLHKNNVLWNDYVNEHNAENKTLNELFGISTVNDSEGENFANKKLLNLWIEKHPNQWKNWKIEYLWLRYCSEFHYEEKEYFNVWKTLYSTEWEKWQKEYFTEWKSMATKIDLLYFWILDGNEIIFDNWAKTNIDNWEIVKDSVMLPYITEAYRKTFNSQIYSYEVENWRKDNPEEWLFWKNILMEEILVQKMFEIN